MTRNRIVILAAVVIGGLLFFSMADFKKEKMEVLVGYWQDGRMQPAPEFSLPEMNGGTLSLSDLKGQIVVLNVWATWCAPCRDEMPALVRTAGQFESEGVTFVGVSVDAGGWEAVRPFVRQYGVNYPIVLDDGTVDDSYEGLTGYPTTYFINRKGQVWRYFPGPLSRMSLVPALMEMLDAEPV